MSKVFIIGLPKTGTTSVAEALRVLGFKVRNNPVDSTSIDQFIKADFNLKVLIENDAISDMPTLGFFEELDEQFPNSKFIFTTRDKKSWLKSCEAWWEFIGDNDVDVKSFSPHHLYHIKVFGCIHFNFKVFGKAYDKWHKKVNDYFSNRENDLLTLPITTQNKWVPICEFLNKKVPLMPFPIINKMENILKYNNSINEEKRNRIKDILNR